MCCELWRCNFYLLTLYQDSTAWSCTKSIANLKILHYLLCTGANTKTGAKCYDGTKTSYDGTKTGAKRQYGTKILLIGVSQDVPKVVPRCGTKSGANSGTKTGAKKTQTVALKVPVDLVPLVPWYRYG